ncbi:iron uptake protein [Hydrogenophaga sp.]|uniref:iron uptake protein n=1 Tax=Hydrogenophaga sp. TaxID=1904254 RepID=UPI0025BD1365|nr:iron uptake protein [Hydrogenophaga sp.]MBT9463949.1 iron uptake protein [Hydrogenophaga sp.]
MTTATSPTTAHVIGRIAASLLGGYAFTWGVTTLGITGLVALGVDYHEAHTVLMLLAFLVFLVAFVWAFAARSLARVWLVLGLGGLCMTGAAWLLQQQLI